MNRRQVVRRLAAALPFSFTPVRGGLLQRKCSCGATPGSTSKCQACSAKLQRQPRDTGLEGRNNSLVPHLVHEVLHSPGRPLDPETRGFFEMRFGHDFGQVRVHTDDRAAHSAAAVRAVAYTVGRHIVFGDGQYVPKTPAGSRLLAHELTHVLQQDQYRNHTKDELRLGASSDPMETIADQAAAAVANDTTGVPVIAPAADTVQRQLVTPLAAGGGFSGLMDRDRQTAARAPTPVPPSETCDFQLCFLPLEFLLDRGVSPDVAYATANHAYIRWNGSSAGFTRLSGESIHDARVISPEPRAGQQHERCLRATFRTVPTPTPGQVIHFSPLDAVGDLISYGVDVVHGLEHCREPGCALARRRIARMLTDDRRGLYDLFDENCETWARKVLAAACFEAPEFRLGGIGNQLFRLLNETTPGRLYHGLRSGIGKTRPTPSPGP